MDKLIADIRRVLEESDLNITVEELLALAKPNGEASDITKFRWYLDVAP
jgi:hypothetical protein